MIDLMSSGFGVMPRSYTVDVEKNRLIVRRVKESLDESMAILRAAQRQPTEAAARAQQRQAANPWFETIPGFEVRPIDLVPPATQRDILNLRQRRE